MAHPPEQQHTVIVGAGPSGLAVGASLRRLGLPFLLIEASHDVGHRWREHYERLHLHTPASDSSLPFLSFPRGTPRYPSRQQVVAYLETYASHFELEPRFGCSLKNLAPVPQGWLLETSEGSIQARQVVMCTGYNRCPQTPASLPASTQPSTTDEGPKVMHAVNYRNPDSVPGPANLVVGIGNTGAEIALDLAEAGRQVEISVRGPLNVVPRELYGLPLNTIARFSRLIPNRVADNMNRRTLDRLYGDLPGYGLNPLPYSAHCQIDQHQRVPLIDVGTIDAIRSGAIKVRPGIASVSGNEVHFVDGSQGRFDGTVLATGYRPRLHELMPALADQLNSAGAPQHSGIEALPGLFFCGFRVSTRGMLNQISREARVVADLLRAAA
ncbi:MAG: NAD(P)/FAD-dependent oxidoreductase [Pseudomonadota bacterium]